MRLLLLLTVAVCAAGQPVPRNRLTFSGGWSREIGGFSRPGDENRKQAGFGHRGVAPSQNRRLPSSAAAAEPTKYPPHPVRATGLNGFLANPSFAHDRWFQVAAEASFRFK